MFETGISNENFIEPGTSSEVLWMLFSVLALDPNRQVEILGGVPHANDLRERARVENGAQYLLNFIYNHYVAWLDEFEPCPIAHQFFKVAWSIPYGQSYEAFMDSEEWGRLRALANGVLEEAGLEPWPAPKFIDFSELNEG